MSRELDAKVAVAVFGYRWMRFNPKCRILSHPNYNTRHLLSPSEIGMSVDGEPVYVPSDDGDDAIDDKAFMSVPRFSTDIEAAWSIVTEFESRGLWFAGHAPPEKGDTYCWSFFRGNRSVSGKKYAKSVQKAICLAALEAVNSDPKTTETEAIARVGLDG